MDLCLLAVAGSRALWPPCCSGSCLSRPKPSRVICFHSAPALSLSGFPKSTSDQKRCSVSSCLGHCRSPSWKPRLRATAKAFPKVTGLFNSWSGLVISSSLLIIFHFFFPCSHAESFLRICKPYPYPRLIVLPFLLDAIWGAGHYILLKTWSHFDSMWDIWTGEHECLSRYLTLSGLTERLVLISQGHNYVPTVFQEMDSGVCAGQLWHNKSVLNQS